MFLFIGEKNRKRAYEKYLVQDFFLYNYHIMLDHYICISVSLDTSGNCSAGKISIYLIQILQIVPIKYIILFLKFLISSCIMYKYKIETLKKFKKNKFNNPNKYSNKLETKDK